VMGKGFDSYLIALQRFADGDLTGRKRRRGGKTTAPAKAAKAAAPAKVEKTLGKPAPAAIPSPPAGKEKTIGPAERSARPGRSPIPGFISRALVRQKISDRLSGKLTAAGLATWARAQYLEVQRGAPAESGQRELLEDSLQTLTLSAIPATRLSDEQMVDLMAQLEG